MKAGRILAAVIVLGATLVASAWAAPNRARRATSVSVVAAPGKAQVVRAGLRSRGFRVDRRAGRRLQVVVRGAAQRAAVARVPGVAAVTTPPSAYGDAVTGQGLERTGASSLADASNGGAGLRIAILDLGFGTEVAGLQARGELPPPARLQLQSFDPAGGIVGTNAYGNPTNHGELVAQTVYDYAPRARYLFVSYHTPDDFVAAVDWLAAQHVDVVVHSNNFLEGPFDGTGPLARAVDRAAAAGVMWFNSAGNYGEKHWAGPWVDKDGDDLLDWPSPTPWTMSHEVNQALTFHLSWENAASGPPSDIDLILQRKRDDGGWDVVRTSEERQSDGAPPAERIVSVRPQTPGVYRLLARLVSGPPPPGDLTLFSREDDIASWAGTAQSIPTPADAAGSISVGALDWRSNSLVRYSSRGPTPDGRVKPDIAAPTGTSLATPAGDPVDVGGTSIAAPNAAGAAALELASMRAAGLRPSAQRIREILTGDALDLGQPGPDTVFGAGRIRVDVDPPSLRPAALVPLTPVRGPLVLAVEASDASQLATWALDVDGVRTRLGRVARDVIGVRLATRELADGPHAASLEVGDAVGNRRSRAWRFTVDNTPPTLELGPVEVLPPKPLPPALRGLVKGPRKRTVRLVARVGDAWSRSIRLSASLVNVHGSPAGERVLSVAVGTSRRFVLARARPGLYVARLVATDVAGNQTRIIQGFRIR